MCRIVGLGYSHKEITDEDRELLKNMRDSLSHGGPDDEGIYVDSEKKIILGHRRLSILDLSKLGCQPMANKENNIWITYNGEIYNYLELRKELESLGCSFVSNTDTEVILEAYQNWGVMAFKKFSGMFSFCIYDKRSHLIYLVRDISGIKPLYYSITNNSFIFSSEIRALEKSNLFVENSDWKPYFLAFGYIPEPYTTLKNVHMLPRESYLELNINSYEYKIEKYENLIYTYDITTFDDAIYQVRTTLTNAIKRHLLSDAPIGVFLSGGIDSSLLAIIASQFLKDELKTLSIIFDENMFSEEQYQKTVVSLINSQHSFHKVSKYDFFTCLPDILQALDQPTVDGVNTYFISKYAKERDLKVVLSGLGGDELFGGYPSFDQIDKTWFLRNIMGSKIFDLWKYSRTNRFKRFSYFWLPFPLGYYLFMHGVFYIREIAVLLDTTEKNIYEILKKISPAKEDVPNHKKNLISYLDKNLYMQNQLLKDNDVFGMWHSLEIRVPMLDNDVVKKIFAIDPNIKFKRNIPKNLLIKAFEDLIPLTITNRCKSGFVFPFSIWLKQNGKKIFQKAVSNQHIDNKYTHTIWKMFENDQIHWKKIWSFIVMENF